MADAVAITNLRFSYPTGAEVLDIPSLRIETGEHIFLYGPSGSGKTTLLGILAGVLAPGKGAVEVLGALVSSFTPAQRDAFRGAHLGYIFQLFNLIPYLSVLDNITLPCRLSAERRRRLKGVSLEEAAAQAARQLGIGDLLLQDVTRLSVGQQQRVAAARALIGTPELVIADEPTSSLDQDHRQRFLELLFSSCRQSGATLIFVSHDRTLQPLFDRAISLPDVNACSQPERIH